MRIVLGGLLLALGAGMAVSASAAAPAQLRGAFDIPAGEQIPARCEATLQSLRAHVAALEAIPPGKVSATTLLAGWNRFILDAYAIAGPLGLAAETHPDKATRAAAEACTLKLSAFDSEYLQSEALFRVVKAAQGNDAIERNALSRILEDFESRGIGLAPERRARLREIFARIDLLSQEFNRNVRDASTQLAYSAQALEGVPASYLERLAKDSNGNYLVGLDYPDRDAVLVNARSEETRKRFFIEFQRRGGERNLAILNEVNALRKELAALFDQPSFAAWQLRTSMAGSPASVDRFLADMQNATKEIELADIALLRDAKRKATGQADASLARWDVDFYDNLLKRERFSVDPSEVRKHFPTEPTVAWLLDVSSHLYGLKFRPNAQLPRWHDDVRAYDVIDGRTGQYLSSFYLDLFPRDGKYKHAAAFPVRPVSLAAGSTPVSVMVSNFSRDGFNQDEVETLFHEFGHILHGVLSQTRYAMEAGTAVRRDYVESPSMMFQEWPWRPEVTRRFSMACASCKPIDAKLIARLQAASHFGKGFWFARQNFYARFDMALAGPQPGEALAVWRTLEAQTPLGTVDGTMPPASFGHLLGGYAAGYYGYMWSMAIGLDMLTAFGKDAMNPKVGMRYRQTILERGGEVPPAELVEQFLGRKPDNRAFFSRIAGKR
ncbi:Zn-dependent oligopeptidase [Niveibacterium sp. 24ML]|uniref:M3 family metallopeptidase n=1 Tax=Niveibacterium sp. 24ML TaxID=2985512 RepID=UPI00226DE7D7|nr:M3 family metallopeptidase [Niveibacterium sp. 24ML]MCX9157011.1 Zn-dependent oligopeptidase [Niveibacterium sp. 24ML]